MYIFLPEQNNFVSLAIKILMAISIVMTAFGIKNSNFMKSLICFCLMSFSFSGLNFAMWLVFKPNGMEVRNGVVYFNISPLVLIISTVLAYTIIEIMNKFLGKHVCEKSFCNVSVKINDKYAKFDAFLDTGNSLKEPFSNLPVILVKKEDINSIIPSDININDENLIFNLFNEFNIKFRLIPFHGVSSTGVILGFKPDSIKIKTSSGKILQKDAYVGICFDKTFEHSLVGPELLDNN